MDADRASLERPVGLALRAIVTSVLLLDAAACLSASEQVANDLAVIAIPASLMAPLGIILLACALAYAVPVTAFLGAVMVTGLLGGAILTHLRLLEFGSLAEIVCILLGIATWAGLWLTDKRVRMLLPLRSPKGANDQDQASAALPRRAAVGAFERRE